MNELTREFLQQIARKTEAEALETGDKLMACVNGNYKLIVYLIDKIDKLEAKLLEDEGKK